MSRSWYRGVMVDAWARGAGVALLLGAMATFGCGSDSDSTAAPSAGASGQCPGGATCAAGNSGIGGVGGAGGSSGGGVGGSGGWASIDKTTPWGACMDYVLAQGQLREQCGENGAAVAGLELDAAKSCPDLFFAPESNATIEEVLQFAEAWRTWPCESWDAWLRPSGHLSPGALPSGSPCAFDSQCQTLACTGSMYGCGRCAEVATEEGAVCDSSSSLPVVCASGFECLGSCAAAPLHNLKEGEDCSDGMCAGPLYCPQLYSSQGRVCTAPRPEGGSCADGETCEEGTHCGEAPMVCVADVTLGGLCKTDWDCQDALHCPVPEGCDQYSPCATPQTCQPRLVAGAPCDPTARTNADRGGCSAGLECACADSGCQSFACLQVRLPGEACGDGLTYCIGNTLCTAGTCVANAAGPFTEELCGP